MLGPSRSPIRWLSLLGLLPFLALTAAPRANAWIQGYATTSDVAQGDTLELHVSTDEAIYSVWIEDAIDPTRVFRQFDGLNGSAFAVPESAFAWGCDWPVTLRVQVDPSWPSAVYYARLISLPTGNVFTAGAPESTFVPFVVREDEPGSTSNILFQLSTNTYNAYNAWGGHSLYPQNSEDHRRSYFVSFHRPYDDEQGKGQFPWWERPLAAWLRNENMPVEFCTNVALHREPDLLSNYDLFLSVGHDEYWSKEMYDQAEAFREAGGNLAFLSGNSIFWSVRFMGDTMVCYKDLDLDPYYALGLYDRVTTNWRNPPLNRPEGRLIGVQFVSWCWQPCGVPEAPSALNHWMTRGRGLHYGDQLGTAVVGYEWDRIFTNAQPEGVQGVFQTVIPNHAGILHMHNSSYYEYPETNPRSRIFGAGTIQWSWGVRPDTAGADSNLVAINRRILRCLSQPSITESDREVIFTADVRDLSLNPGTTIWLRGTPAPLEPNSLDFPMLDDGIPPDSTAADGIRACAVLFPAGSWNIAEYGYWTSVGNCYPWLNSTWIEDPDLGPGPTVRLTLDRPEWCPTPPATAVEESEEPAGSLALEVRPAPAGVQIEVTAPASGGAGKGAPPAQLRVAIYDATGRLVRLFAGGTLVSGRASLLWRGEDERGHAQPTGVYLVQASVGEAEQVAKVFHRSRGH